MATTSIDATAETHRPRTKLLAALRKTDSSESSDSSADSASDGSDSEDVLSNNPIFKSRPQPRITSPEAEQEVDAESAYQRMKQRLAAEKTLQEQHVQKEAPIPVMAVSSHDEEEEMPVRKPARKQIAENQRNSSPRASTPPSVRSRRTSFGLFVSPHPSPVRNLSPLARSAGSGSERSPERAAATDLQERVKRIRAQRLAKQAEEEEEAKKERHVLSKRLSGRDAGSDTDSEVDRRLTQQAKPTRRAGKKALEAMARDQQRISRNMQLTHQSKTKKRYSTKDLFTKFGFNAADDKAATQPPTPELISALVSSDTEARPVHDTPPTSPPTLDENAAKTTLKATSTIPTGTVIEQANATSSIPIRSDKGKGRAPEFAHLPPRTWPTESQSLVVQHNQSELMGPADDTMVELSDSDDDAKAASKNRFAVFDRIRTKEQDDSKSFVTLRHLAHLTSPNNNRKGPKMISRNEMHFSLALKARQQAQKVRQERIEELKRRGIHIETAEELEKNQIEIEDMVAQFEKQRQEDLKLAKLEKKEAKANGESIDELPSSDESDDDYVGSGEENAAGADDDDQEDEEEVDELELSGSEDELMEDKNVQGAEATNDLIDGAAEEDEGAGPEDTLLSETNELTDDDDEPNAPVRMQTSKRIRRVIDDDDDDGESDSKASKAGSSTHKATQEDAKAAFGFSNSNMSLGLTQMFAGTMANLDDSQATYREPEQDSLDFLRSLPATQPHVNFSQADDTLVPNSQLFASPRKESQTGAEYHFSLGVSQVIGRSPSGTQFSEAPEPTQDAGFSFSRSPAGFMAPISTTETLMLSIAESPIKKRTGKLQRGRRETAVEVSDVEEELLEAASDMSDVDDIQRPPKHRDAFRAMQKGAKKQKAIDEFNKKTSLAKNVVEEQADESEDEYAGIGGVSDDDSGEEDEELKDMIDHNDVEINEREIAALHADKSKKDDEKNINQLYKDLMSGGLRKRAGRDAFDMSDSEDEAERMQRKKRADFARMQKALMSDENIGKIAENPKQQAFFKTLADFADDAEYDFLEMPEPKSIYAEDSQSQSQSEKIEDEAGGEMVVPNSQLSTSCPYSITMPPPNPLKRRSPSSSQKENRPPPALRRIDNSLARRPITLADVQHSVSELLEDSRELVPDSQYASDSDSDLEIVDRPVRKAVDRLTLSRQSTLDESQSQSSAEGLAFHAPSRGPAVPGFRVPSLIRQATSNLSATSDRSERMSQSSEGSVRRGGNAKSNIHAQAREAERRALLEKKEKKRKEAIRKKVNGARRTGGMRSVLGDLGGGFE